MHETRTDFLFASLQIPPMSVVKGEVTESRERVRCIRAMMKRTMVVDMKDGREIYGRFVCYDRLQNIILSGAEEHVTVDTIRKVLNHSSSSQLEGFMIAFAVRTSARVLHLYS